MVSKAKKNQKVADDSASDSSEGDDQLIIGGGDFANDGVDDTNFEQKPD